MSRVERMGRVLAVVMAAPLLHACVDFVPTDATGPSEPANRQPARFSAQLHLTTGSQEEQVSPPRAAGDALPRHGEAGNDVAGVVQPTLRLNAAFLPGRDAHGAIRAVTKDTITVLDRKIAAEEAGSSEALVFRDEWSPRLDNGQDAAWLHTPHVAGLEQPPPTLEFRLCRADGPYDLAIARDDTVRLEISCPRSVKPADQVFGEVTFRSADGRSFLGLSGSDSLPSSVPMPALTLEHLGQSDLIATFRVTEAWWQESDGDYEVYLAVVSESFWTLRWK